MTRCEFSPEARADLLQIHDRIAQDSPSSALRFIDRLEQQCYRLADYPYMGRSRSDLGSGLRSFVVPRTRYVIIYRVVTDGIQIIHVRQGGQDLNRLLNQ
jgi:addiction module RelE/StbE family toxin